MDQSKNKPLLIIDGYGFVYRAYHVQPPLTSPDGKPVGAVYGLISMLIKLINDFKPEYAVVVLDSKGKNFRHNLFAKYKANRPPAPEELISQLSIVPEAAKALNLCVVAKEGFEADDIIATIATHCVDSNQEAVIVSADKDLLQLMGDKIQIYDPSKSKFMLETDIIAKFGVSASSVREVQALMGDTSDNIPGVKGIGPKIASELINNFGNLKGVYDSLDQIKNARIRELLKTYKDDAFISWQLVGLDKNVDINQEIESFVWKPPHHQKIGEFIAKYGFKSLTKRIEGLVGGSVLVPFKAVAPLLTKDEQDVPIQSDKISPEPEDILQKIQNTGIVAVSFEIIENGVRVFLNVENQIYNLNYRSDDKNSTDDLFSYSKQGNASKYFNNFIDKIFSDSSIKKITYDLKSIYKHFKCELNSFDDLSLMYYCLNAGNNILENKNDDIIVYYQELKAQLFEEKTLHLYETIDLPLCRILHQMEEEGIKIDIGYLQKLSRDFGQTMILLEKEIFSLCDKEFNISSPKQLGEILFDKMKLPFAKLSAKSKTYVTSIGVLEKLSENGYLVADLILKYRHLAKLKNTYTQALPKQASTKDHRIRTTFLQNSTTTGRLSSNNPNVQNIPVRTFEGNQIRKAFIAREGYKLISADYSQIELRILSHVANISALKEAFANGRDIHTHTASQIFSTSLSDITSESRQRAKAINFGIIYGISAFGLARNLNISKKEAADYMTKYFAEYPGIEKYMKETIDFARKHFYVKNLLGRRCYLPSINDKNHVLRSFAERGAINAPMQSLTADIAKMSMVSIAKKLLQQGLATKMLLQIHDELIFESPIKEVDQAAKLIKSTMENIITLEVPIKVDISYGDNWQEL